MTNISKCISTIAILLMLLTGSLIGCDPEKQEVLTPEPVAPEFGNSSGKVGTTVTVSCQGTRPGAQAYTGAVVFYDVVNISGGTFTATGPVFHSGTVTLSNTLNIAQSATPSAPTLGDIFHSSNAKLYFYNGSAWDALN